MFSNSMLSTQSYATFFLMKYELNLENYITKVVTVTIA